MTIPAISSSKQTFLNTTEDRQEAIKLFGENAESLQRCAGDWEKLMADWDISYKLFIYQ